VYFRANVFNILHITDGGHPAELRHEEIGRRLGEPESEEPFASLSSA
jgi:hypothetical protein